ncbi:MAG: helix-turn-helix transcriptional regulator, partial [bacterium]|nr:helix-turn-helix transcriptional regulator [bacterium]
VSRHLATLREAGVVEATKAGKEVHYRVCFTDLVSTLRQVADAIEACCPLEQPQDESK